MIHFYQTLDNSVREVREPSPGCWISVTDPTAQEVQSLIENYGLDSGFVRSSLDEEESSRIEREDDQTLIIVDTAVSEIQTEDTILFFTVPLGIIITDDYVFTISLRDNRILRDMAEGLVKGVQTRMKTRFVMQLLLRITAIYLQDLKQIDKTSQVMEQKLSGAMKNQELVQMLELEKSLVYFSTSLKANEVTIEKLLRGRTIKLYDEDQQVRGFEQQTAECEPRLFAAGKAGDLPVKLLLREAHAEQHRADPHINIVTAVCQKPRLQTVVFGGQGGIALAEPVLELAHPRLALQKLREYAAHLLADGLFGIERRRLRQIPHARLGGTDDLPVALLHVIGEQLTQQDFQQRGFAASICADQTDAICVLDLQADVRQERFAVEHFIDMICFQQHRITSLF